MHCAAPVPTGRSAPPPPIRQNSAAQLALADGWCGGRRPARDGLAEHEPRRLGLARHPVVRVIGVAAADVAVPADEPALLDLLPGRRLVRPDRREERRAQLVDGQRLAGVTDVRAQPLVVEPPPHARDRTDQQAGDAERADRVPYAHELQRELVHRPRAVVGAEPDHVGHVGRRVATPVEVVRGPQCAVVERPRQEADLADEAGGGPHGERAAAEAEEPELVARLVLLDEPAVRLLHVPGQPGPERAAAKVVERVLEPPLPDAALRLRAHPDVVEHQLVRALGDGVAQLRDVGPRRGVVPGPVLEDDQAAHGAPPRSVPGGGGGGDGVRRRRSRRAAAAGMGAVRSAPPA